MGVDSPRVPEAAQPESSLVGAPDKERPVAREEGRASLREFLYVRCGQSKKVHVAERQNGPTRGYQTRCGLYSTEWRLGYWMQTVYGATEATCKRCAFVLEGRRDRQPA